MSTMDELVAPTMQPHHETIIKGIQVLTIVVIIGLFLICICIGLLMIVVCQRRHDDKSRIFNSTSNVSVRKRVPSSEDIDQIEGNEEIPLPLNGRPHMDSEGPKITHVETHYLVP